MAWRFVRQPNGLLARFCDVADNFTHYNLTPEAALRIARDAFGRRTAEQKVQAAIEDLPESRRRHKSGFSRWHESLGLIELRHGKAERAKVEGIWKDKAG